MASVFISYARIDGRDLADRLATGLEQNDHAPWLDRAEIQGGEEWSRAIETAIDGCDVLLAVLTRGSYDSRICRSEQSRALRKNKRIVPLLGQADAERPIYLESANYLDFSDAAAFDPVFRALLDTLESDAGVRLDDLPARRRDRLAGDGNVRSMAAAIHERSADWSQIVELADHQRTRFFDVLAPRRDGIGIFEPSLYVERRPAEQELARFTDGDVPGLVIVGDSGSGKTNVLCSFALREADAGHAVLMYHCDRLTSSDIEHELMRDLGIEDTTTFAEAVAAIDELANTAGRRLIVVFDGINRFRGRESERPRELLAAVDDLVARVPATAVRVIMSCSTPAWTRIERLGVAALSWNRYHRTRTEDEVLVVSDFDEGEAGAAYEKYRAHFGLATAFQELPAALRIRLRDPLLLRLFAETSGTGPIAGDDPLLDTLIQRYLADRVRQRADRLFLDELAGEMYARNHATLPVHALASHPVLGPAVLDEGPDSSYSRLLDAGILVEVEGDGLFTDEMVRFAYPLIGAFTLAARLLRAADPLESTARDLVDRSEQLTFAWEAAAIMLVARGADADFAGLATSPRLELRELATDGLVRLHATDAGRTRTILTSLLDGDSVEGRRAALRAAYCIGPATRDLFLHAAMSGSEDVRQAVRDTLYLIWSGQARAGREPAASTGYFLWRLAPDFTYGLMRDMVGRVSWTRPREAGRILRFVLDLAITIYVNHCDREDVTQQTADLYYELTVNRLHLDRIALGSRLQRVVLRVVAAVFSKRILDWVMTGDRTDPDAFFRLPVRDREILRELAGFLDPGSDFRAARPAIARALSSDRDVFRGCAALVCAIHAHAGFERSEPDLRLLFDSLEPHGRVWLLIGLSVLLPTTPAAWIPLLEDFTRRIFALPNGRQEGDLPDELLCLPLGLAYGKEGAAMPLFDELLTDAVARADDRTVDRIVGGLGPVGFYYPAAALGTLRPHHAALTSEPSRRNALITALGTIRILHVDRVDAFLMHEGIDDALQRRVAATADVKLVHRFVHAVGYYNNAVHYCVNYPRMRRGLGAFALELLARADSAGDFIVDYAEQGIAMARDAGFRLIEWTLPDDDSARLTAVERRYSEGAAR